MAQLGAKTSLQDLEGTRIRYLMFMGSQLGLGDSERLMALNAAIRSMGEPHDEYHPQQADYTCEDPGLKPNALTE